MFDGAFIKRIQDTLGTAEEGDALIEFIKALVAERNSLLQIVYELKMHGMQK